jgi:hypothetical protein
MVPISYTSVNYFTTFGLAWLGEDRAKCGARAFVAEHLRHSCCLTKEVALSGNKDGIVAMHDLLLCSDTPFLFPQINLSIGLSKPMFFGELQTEITVLRTWKPELAYRPGKSMRV